MLRIELSAGFLFFLALLAHWDAGGVFWPYLAAAALHEAAHIAAICAFGGRVHSLRLGFGDAQLQTGLLPERALFWCAAAGPAVNLLCGLTLGTHAPVFSALSLLLGLYNLLPIAPLDGGQLLRIALTRLSPARGAMLAHITGCISAAALLALSIYGARTLSTGPWPVLAAVLLSVRACRACRHYACSPVL